MLFRIFPCIIKHHDSVKYMKYFVSISRQKGSKSRSSSLKILAASSSCVTKPVHKEFDNEKQLKIKDNGKVDSHFPNIPVHENSFGKESIFHQEIHQHLKPNQSNLTASLPETPEAEKESVKLLNTVKPADLDWRKQILDVHLLPRHYKGLSKFRLTGLVVITTLAGYGMAPGAFEPITLLCMVLGTGLTSAAANAVNQVLEVPYDSQMARTKNRVLIRGHLTSLHAATFAACCASIGLSTLYFGTNTLTAALGATNLILYTSIYTPMKRYSIANTWLGSIVGAIPPLMGWAASSGTLSAGALLMGAILYSWQFPHFNALSWNLRPDYSKAGYRMTSVVNPAMCRRVALRHSIGLLVLCSCAPLVDLTTWTFAFDSLPLNCYLIYHSWKFYTDSDSYSARKLFRLSLIYLPALMFLMFVGKKYTRNEKLEEKSS
ncbi:protoheme IX farnesyltransferase, mitochondrial [Trichonephila clavata]|uniref:Protoheme IX farnesyltransferase, mitochondrial n=1 Tax=Trichonephila clavata TaxID=2740835 RepID=A0A8X6HPN7_TRICU|nr:protoheme IX farnesyltransferase, mitochondrial [Trichonephila clavata]